jgi:arsenite methyltransferase
VPTIPDWLGDRLGVSIPAEGGEVDIDGTSFIASGGVLRSSDLHSAAQSQTAEAFGDKWQRRDTFESAASLERVRRWLIERYGDVEHAAWWTDYGERPVVVDAGCGAAMSAIELFGARLAEVDYIGVDVSAAVDVAAKRLEERGYPGAFVQCDLGRMPIPDGSVDVVFSEGVLHHTDSTEAALHSVARLLRPNGRLLFYVYKKKGPIREFTDDYVREKLQALTPDEAWEAVRPLTLLGQALGDLDVEIDVPVDVDLLGIPAGRINIQRLVYWHVIKAFHDPTLSIDELNHINFDWFAPANAHRQTVEEVWSWCADAGLTVERERMEDAGITMIARR